MGGRFTGAVAISVLLLGCTGEPLRSDAGGPTRTQIVAPPAVATHVVQDRCSAGGCARVCAVGYDCRFTCSGGDCSDRCEAGSACAMTCSGGDCTQRCEAGASCRATCSGGGCNQPCADTAECEATCSGTGC